VTTAPENPQAGIADAFSQLSEQTAALVRQEIQSARDELQRKLSGLVVAGALLGGATALGGFAAASLHAWLLRVLEKRLPPASAALLAGVLYGGAAGALGAAGVRRLRQSEAPYPTETLHQTATVIREATNRPEPGLGR
jgi:hypothetical protein